jgi:non-ribosomal peptide synthetase component F
MTTVHGLFERQVAATPGTPALVFAGGEISYEDTNAAANRLARRPRDAGVEEETRVVVFLERSPTTVIGQLAVLKAGARSSRSIPPIRPTASHSSSRTLPRRSY